MSGTLTQEQLAKIHQKAREQCQSSVKFQCGQPPIPTVPLLYKPRLDLDSFVAYQPGSLDQHVQQSALLSEDFGFPDFVDILSWLGPSAPSLEDGLGGGSGATAAAAEQAPTMHPDDIELLPENMIDPALRRLLAPDRKTPPLHLPISTAVLAAPDGSALQQGPLPTWLRSTEYTELPTWQRGEEDARRKRRQLLPEKAAAAAAAPDLLQPPPPTSEESLQKLRQDIDLTFEVASKLDSEMRQFTEALLQQATTQPAAATREWLVHPNPELRHKVKPVGVYPIVPSFENVGPTFVTCAFLDGCPIPADKLLATTTTSSSNNAAKDFFALPAATQRRLLAESTLHSGSVLVPARLVDPPGGAAQKGAVVAEEEEVTFLLPRHAEALKRRRDEETASAAEETTTTTLEFDRVGEYVAAAVAAPALSDATEAIPTPTPTPTPANADAGEPRSSLAPAAKAVKELVLMIGPRGQQQQQQPECRYLKVDQRVHLKRKPVTAVVVGEEAVAGGSSRRGVYLMDTRPLTVEEQLEAEKRRLCVEGALNE